MGKINRLNEHLTNMIAAGEVVERPMGVLKELVENAIDAKATSIEVQIVEGGLTNILVIDNGEGMDSEDASKAFHRHSTSKIAQEQDLWSIQSLGFRGEALPSIASVSNVICLTNNQIDSTKVHISYGKLMEVTPYPSAHGTSIEVSGLFLKTPARLKHMKSVPYETTLCLDVIQKFALSYPNIAFKMIVDDRVVLETTGKNELREVMYRLYGADVASNTIEINAKTRDYQLSGVLVLPSIHKASRKEITLFTNQRLIRSSKIQKAILDGYRHFLPSDRYPIVVLSIVADAKLLDVNVHPSKWEVRISKENELLDFIEKTTYKTISEYIQPQVIKKNETITKYNPIQLFEKDEPTVSFEVMEDSVDDHPTQINAAVKSGFPSLTIMSQLHQKYILAQAHDSLMIIDQHAAMERVRYEYFQSIYQKPHHQQPLLIPITITQTAAIIQKDKLIEYFETLMIQVETLSEQALIIRYLPSWITQTDNQRFIDDMVEHFLNNRAISNVDAQKKLLSSLACHSSVRFNQNLSIEQMKKLVEDLSQCEQPYQCPHGRPTIIQIPLESLLKEFYR